MTTAIMCFTCREPIETKNGNPKFAATFHGKQRRVCHDCGQGISSGDAILRKLKVTGECLTNVGDNLTPLK